jgi:ubiquinol-cytochrome c reductase subunit 6
MDAKLFFPRKHTYSGESFNTLVPSSKNLLDRGIDPKPTLLEFCEPMCTFWKEKLERCEQKLDKILKLNPSKSCLYPMRDWVTCVDSCVQPKIFNNLERGQDH